MFHFYLVFVGALIRSFEVCVCNGFYHQARDNMIKKQTKDLDALTICLWRNIVSKLESSGHCKYSGYLEKYYEKMFHCQFRA